MFIETKYFLLDLSKPAICVVFTPTKPFDSIDSVADSLNGFQVFMYFRARAIRFCNVYTTTSNLFYCQMIKRSK